jgi:hypothetical protein
MFNSKSILQTQVKHSNTTTQQVSTILFDSALTFKESNFVQSLSEQM